MDIDGTRSIEYSLRATSEMAVRVKEYSWEATSLGSLHDWPLILQSSLSICLNSNFPIALYWGPELVLIYNDAWSPIPGKKHPWALGKPAREVWPEIWNDIEPQFKKAFGGQPGGSRDALLPMQRHGYTEECYFDFTFTPIFGFDGTVDGIFNAVVETTYRVISERRNSFLQEFSNAIGGVSSFGEVAQTAVKVIRDNPKDIPYAMIYSVSKGGKLQFIDGTEGHEPALKRDWPHEDALSDGHPIHLKDLHYYLFEVPKGPWPEAPKEALLVPLKGNDPATRYFIVFGISSRRALDKEYQSFLELVAGSLSNAIGIISSLEQERTRAKALADIDRAKTLFFTNISHEFRTPLTLILGSLEEMLQKPGVADDSENLTALETTHRNAMRLLQLVNNLLDFSRIEAGRERASFQSLDIAQLTRELASNFSSLMKSAGLSYQIDIEPVGDTVFVDKLMWEKIVLNIISNAFKYTLKGTILISLAKRGPVIQFAVKDTGVGIPKDELPRMFERFHRVQNVGRTYEGTGIGLSLVNELVRLHGGTVSLNSEVGHGTEVIVTIPTGKDHLPQEQVVGSAGRLDETLVESFVKKASSLVDGQRGEVADNAPASGKEDLERILVVDDNADMRTYIRNLLQRRFQITTASNGREALEKIHNECPDMVVSDIMMPVMDGVELVKAIKADPKTNNLPVILLSARAGEEARIEGFELGADDYLVKPFSAKELVARIHSQLQLARIRKEVEVTLRNVILQSPMPTVLLRGPLFIIEIVNSRGLEVWGRTYEEVINKPIAVALPEIAEQGFDKLLQQVYATGEPFIGSETPVQLMRFGKPQMVFLNFIYSPFRDSDDNVIGIIAVGIDVTDQVNARRLVEEAKSNLSNAIELGELGTWQIDLKNQYATYSERVAEWWGLPKTGANLKDIIDCVHPDDRERVMRAVERTADNAGKYQADYRLINSVTKQERYIEANGNISLSQDGTPLQLSGIVRDVTFQRNARKELERQVFLRTQELEAVNIDLQRSNSELMQFAYVASHDLQEPLRKIQTFSDMVKKKWDHEAEAKAYLDKIDSSAARMSGLIKDVLLYSKVSNEAREVETVKLNEILRNVRTDFELFIEERGATILADELPTIECSKLQFHQLFSNLIGNSLKFSQNQKHPLVEIRYAIDRSADTKGDGENRLYHNFVFKDNGIGFDEAHADQLFKLFSRLHNRKDYGGTGIGLALCKKIVENHNGTLTARSSEGKGAIFTVRLPVQE